MQDQRYESEDNQWTVVVANDFTDKVKSEKYSSQEICDVDEAGLGKAKLTLRARNKLWKSTIVERAMKVKMLNTNAKEDLLYTSESSRYRARAINGIAPGYLQSCFTHLADVTSRQRLRSYRLVVPSVRVSVVGRRAFPVSGANTPNDLPPNVTSVPSLAVFRQRLKTFLFSTHTRTSSFNLHIFFHHLWTPTQ